MNPIEQIKNRLSILDVVSAYVRLEKSGKQYKGRCPFHNEKTPSFYVSPEYEWFNCFGCNKSGDILTFVQEIEHIEFVEALKILAEKAGVELTDNGKSSKADYALDSILQDTKSIYVKNLQDSPSAQLYLEERGLSKSTIKEFEIGFSLNEWRHVHTLLSKKGYRESDISDAGLIIKTEKGYYDRFRGRVMFPIHNHTNKIVGFTGRIHPEIERASEKSVAKYVNTPETKLYHKSKILYGLNLAKNEIALKDKCIVVEGQMDVIMSHQAGVKNVVAISGTAFTEDQLKMIKRLTDNILFALDSDKAGIDALIRSSKIALMLDMNVSAVSFSGKKDPADLIKENPDNWHSELKNEKDIVSFLLEHYSNSLENKDRDKLISLIKKNIFPVINSIGSEMTKDIYINKLATHINQPIENIRQDISKYTDNTNQAEVASTKPTKESLSSLQKSYLLYKYDTDNLDNFKKDIAEIFSSFKEVESHIKLIPESEEKNFALKNEKANETNKELLKNNLKNLSKNFTVSALEYMIKYYTINIRSDSDYPNKILTLKKQINSLK